MLEINNPYSGELLEKVRLSSPVDVEQALSKAHALFEDRSAWLPVHQRIAILERTVEIMSSQIEELTKLACSEGGKPYADSEVEVLRAINGVKLAIEHIPQNVGHQIPMGPHSLFS